MNRPVNEDIDDVLTRLDELYLLRKNRFFNLNLFKQLCIERGVTKTRKCAVYIHIYIYILYIYLSYQIIPKRRIWMNKFQTFSLNFISQKSKRSNVVIRQ